MAQKDLSNVSRDLYRDGIEKQVREESKKFNVWYADLRKSSIHDDVLSYLSLEEATKYKAIPLKVVSKELYLGTTNPKLDFSPLIADLKKLYKFKAVNLALISEPSYADWLEKYDHINKYIPPDSDTGYIDVTRTQAYKSFTELDEQLKTAPIQDLLKILLLSGFTVGASDIHIEPSKDGAIIRLRLDGVMHEAAKVEVDRFRYLLSQIELRSNLKLNAEYPQNGRFAIRTDEFDYGVRIETMPSMHGESIVMRLFNTQSQMLKIEELGFSEYNEPRLKKSLMRPHGMILLVGPTGAGKTTTIYSILNVLNTKEVKIITLEDPIEYEMPGVTQSQINEGETFADRFKAILREDPDIIMVGEIRDSATADTALQAALTGHLMISTLHANDAITAIKRLIDLIGDAPLVVASTNLIIAQRLVRKICPSCKREYQPNKYELSELEKIIAKVPKDFLPKEPYVFYEGGGCDECQGIGFKGRIGIFELLESSNNLQKKINEGATISELLEVACSDGMITMEQDGILKALNGVTTLGEVLKTIRE
ncbi:MAG: GspE/PulE family protein [Patescibacteria group bacterium]|jgi:type II secretory ATPase GspE/PulE/Tfp pilus assembly ATPase PilB-like protein|nr:GspE/PulE family protein [Patescibacteria group bacterium]